MFLATPTTQPEKKLTDTVYYTEYSIDDSIIYAI
jgi:hypothetical protein